jgi:hypothetical protein
VCLHPKILEFIPIFTKILKSTGALYIAVLNWSIHDHTKLANKGTFLQLHHVFCFNLQKNNKRLEIATGIYTVHIYIQMGYKQNALFIVFVIMAPS